MKALLLFSGALLTASLGAAQQPQVFEDAIDVRVVNVEAVVTDGKGDPVRGLTAADFRLVVDGKEVPVDFFTEVAEGTASAPPAASSPAQAPVAAGEAVGRNFLIFIDESFAIAGSRDLVLSKLEQDLGLLGAEDRMALLAFDGAEIDVLARWTNDRAVLAAALAEARRRPVLGHRAQANDRKMEEDVTMILTNRESLDDGDATLSVVGAVLNELSKRISPEARSQLGKSAPAAAAALRAFGAPPGRKVLMLLSGAWSLKVAGPLYAPMIEAANRLGYTIYPVEVANSAPGAVNGFDELARLTGGRAVASTKAEAFREVVADTGSYYWLGFTPTWKANDRSHRVTVEVRRAGLKTRARGTFSDLSKRTENALKAEGALLFGGQPEHKRLIVQLGRSKPAGRKQIEVEVVLGVPVEALALVPEGNGYLAQTPLAVAALDADGGRADLPGSTLRVLIQEIPKGGGYARFQTKIRLRNAPQRLVFTVQDPVQGTALWGEAEFRPDLTPGPSPGGRGETSNTKPQASLRFPPLLSGEGARG
jgi:VWFA-related protein